MKLTTALTILVAILALFASAGSECRASQIEIEVRFVEYDLADIQEASGVRPIRIEPLVDLLKKGKGKLLAAPKVVTKSGQQATVKGVIEVIYPTDYTFDMPERTNAAAASTNIPPIRLIAFQTREAGVLLELLPELYTDDGATINLTLSAQIVGTPEWHKHEASFTDGNDIERKTFVEQPFFPVATFTTSLAVKNGATVVASGIQYGNSGKVVYFFVSAQLLDEEGQPVFMKKEGF